MYTHLMSTRLTDANKYLYDELKKTSGLKVNVFVNLIFQEITELAVASSMTPVEYIRHLWIKHNVK